MLDAVRPETPLTVMLSRVVPESWSIAFAAAGSLLARFYRNPLVANVAIGLSVGIVISATSTARRPGRSLR